MEDTVSARKKELRLSMKERLSALCQGERNDQSQKACSLFILSDVYKEATTILSYMAMDSEISPLAITDRALLDRKKVALPRIVPHTGDLSFYYVSGDAPLESQLVSGMWGIKEPYAEARNLFTMAAPSSEAVVIIVPGVAFTKKGERLGHGRGYYDKYIASLKKDAAAGQGRIFLVGMCLEEQLVAHIPTDEFDERMDYLLAPGHFFESAE